MSWFRIIVELVELASILIILHYVDILMTERRQRLESKEVHSTTDN